MEQWGDYRLADYTWSNSAAAIHHISKFNSFQNSLSTLLNRVICASRQKREDKEIGGRATDTEKMRKKCQDERGAELFYSVAMVTHRPEL